MLLSNGQAVEAKRRQNVNWGTFGTATFRRGHFGLRDTRLRHYSQGR